jgi:hypothetical protein
MMLELVTSLAQNFASALPMGSARDRPSLFIRKPLSYGVDHCPGSSPSKETTEMTYASPL